MISINKKARSKHLLRVFLFVKLITNGLFEFLDSRLDLILFKTKWYSSINFIHFIIKQGYIFVNKKPIKKSSFILKSGDIINFKSYFIWLDQAVTMKWPVLPTNLVINYKIKELIFVGNSVNEVSFIFYSNFYLYLHKFLINL